MKKLVISLLLIVLVNGCAKAPPKSQHQVVDPQNRKKAQIKETKQIKKRLSKIKKEKKKCHKNSPCYRKLCEEEKGLKDKLNWLK